MGCCYWHHTLLNLGIFFFLPGFFFIDVMSFWYFGSKASFRNHLQIPAKWRCCLDQEEKWLTWCLKHMHWTCFISPPWIWGTMEKRYLMAVVVLIGLTVRWTVSLNSYSGNTLLLFKRRVNITLKRSFHLFLWSQFIVFRLGQRRISVDMSRKYTAMSNFYKKYVRELNGLCDLRKQKCIQIRRMPHSEVVRSV